MIKPAIVIPAYNRPHSLKRLLESLSRASYPKDVHLVISIDYGGSRGEQVRRIAAQLNWKAGPKSIITHERQLGLIGNVFFCGDLSLALGPVILLEDDLFVSPVFYDYACQALDCYADDPRIAGISLNALWFNGYTKRPLEPYLDDYDLFFMQVAWFQGQVYSQEQWKRFAEWRLKPGAISNSSAGLHPLFDAFPKTDWFPTKTRYLVDSGRYYAFPRQSLSTNYGEVGTHFSKGTDFFQVPLQRHRRCFRMGALDDSLAVYDSFQEMLPSRLNRLTDRLTAFDYVVDLNGTRELERVEQEYILTTRPCHNALFTFGMTMRPLVDNVVEAVPGTGISFCRTAEVKRARFAQFRADQRLADYSWRGRPGLRRQMAAWLMRTLGVLDND